MVDCGVQRGYPKRIRPSRLEADWIAFAFELDHGEKPRTTTTTRTSRIGGLEPFLSA